MTILRGLLKLKQSLVLFTRAFPYGKEETFLETEILTLASSFEEIIVVPLEKQNGIMRALPGNIKVLTPVFEKRTMGYFLIAFMRMLSSYFFVRNVLTDKISINSFKQLLIVSHFRRWLFRNNIPHSKDDIWYFYWGVNHTNYLAFFKTEARTFARFHGYDIYEKDHAIPFRKELLDNLDHIVCISKHGAQYISKKYPAYKSKVVVFKLGTLDRGYKKNVDVEPPFRIVTCSNVIPLKRVDLVADALKNVSLDLHWTHFGEGVDYLKLKEKIKLLPRNIKVNLPGRIPNSDVFKYYIENEIHLFLNVSSSEGIPVSIMEAISFGVPVIATDVNGNGEIVNNFIGKLINKDFDSKELAVEIESILTSPDYVSLRAAARKKWEEEYSAEVNYQRFCSFLKDSTK